MTKKEVREILKNIRTQIAYLNTNEFQYDYSKMRGAEMMKNKVLSLYDDIIPFPLETKKEIKEREKMERTRMRMPNVEKFGDVLFRWKYDFNTRQLICPMCGYIASHRGLVVCPKCFIRFKGD